VKPVSKPAAFSQCPFRVMAGGGLLFLPFGVYRHSYDDNGNLNSTELPDGQSLSYLYYGSGHLQQMNWRERGKQTVLAEYSRDRLHRETNRLSGGLDQRTEYDSSGRITAQIARLANSTRVTAATIDKRYTWDKHNNLTERSVSYGQTDSPPLRVTGSMKPTVMIRLGS